MTAHRAHCRCGALTAEANGEPVRVSVCHCRDCQRRSGSAFSAQVRFPAERVVVAGPTTSYQVTGDSGRWGRFHFCPTCGTTVAYEIEAMPDVVAIPLGTFEDPDAFDPRHSVWEDRKLDWVAVTGEVEHNN
jgi:hypothetical protein